MQWANPQKTTADAVAVATEHNTVKMFTANLQEITTSESGLSTYCVFKLALVKTIQLLQSDFFKENAKRCHQMMLLCLDYRTVISCEKT